MIHASQATPDQLKRGLISGQLCYWHEYVVRMFQKSGSNARWISLNEQQLSEPQQRKALTAQLLQQQDLFSTDCRVLLRLSKMPTPAHTEVIASLLEAEIDMLICLSVVTQAKHPLSTLCKHHRCHVIGTGQLSPQQTRFWAQSLPETESLKLTPNQLQSLVTYCQLDPYLIEQVLIQLSLLHLQQPFMIDDALNQIGFFHASPELFHLTEMALQGKVTQTMAMLEQLEHAGQPLALVLFFIVKAVIQKLRNHPKSAHHTLTQAKALDIAIKTSSLSNPWQAFRKLLGDMAMANISN